MSTKAPSIEVREGETSDVETPISSPSQADQLISSFVVRTSLAFLDLAA